MAIFEVQTSAGGLKVSEFNQESISEVLSLLRYSFGFENKLLNLNFFYIDFRGDRCDPESRGSVSSDRPLLNVNPPLIGL